MTKVLTPLPAGATAVYTSSGLAYYRHPDWLGSSRLATTPSHGIYYDGAYAPYGEAYAETGTTDRSFTGQNQDLTPGATGDLYDFMYREYHSTQGRWVSPDPAGMAAVDPANPQSWNRYAYVMGDPASSTDPLGLDQTISLRPYPDPPITCQQFLVRYNLTNFPGAATICGALQSAFGPTYFAGGPSGGSGGGGGGTPARLPPCNDASNNRSRFFKQLPGLLDVSKQLNVPSKYIVGLSSYESGWLDDHNNNLNNLWGLTKNGGNNISFSSKQAGNTYFVKRVGPYIQGAQTLTAFFEGLQKEGYNSANPDYFDLDPTIGVLSNRISNIEKWGQACGKSF